MNQTITAILFFPASTLICYILAGCCAFDKRKSATRCMGALLYPIAGGFIALSLAALIIAVEPSGRVCRGQYLNNQTDSAWGFSPILDQNQQEMLGYAKVTANYLFYFGLLFCVVVFSLLILFLSWVGNDSLKSLAELTKPKPNLVKAIF